MTAGFDGELAGVHDLRGDARAAELLGRALPAATVVEAGALTLAGTAPATADDVVVVLAGRVQRPAALCAKLGLAPTVGVGGVVAAGYARCGVKLVECLRGPFALVAWDRRRGRGVLAQDPLGGRSLFTFADGPRLFFATEVCLLLRLLGRRPEPDDVALAYHLVDHSVPDGRMLYRGIRRIGAGRHIELSNCGRTEGRHWAPRYVPPLRVPRAELAARLRVELAAAVKETVPCRGTSALLLSGGLDSSIVGALSAPVAGNLHAVSAGFSAEPELDETRWAQRVADTAGFPLTTVEIECREPLDAAQAFLRAWQLPLPSPGIVIEAPLVAAAAGLGADVALDGQGGDELFGPAHFLIADRLRSLRPMSAWHLARRYPSIGRTPPARHVRRVLTNIGVRGALPACIHEPLRRRQPPERYLPPWLRTGLARRFRETEDPWRWKRLAGPRWWASLADTLTRGRERADIADYVRRRARMGGLEARSPLLDLGLVEFVLRLPPETNFDPVVSRPLAREALAGILPADVLGRTDKSDFSAFYHRTLTTPECLERIRRLLDIRGASVGEFVDVGCLQREHLDRPPSVGEPGWRGWAVQVWNVVTAELWLRSHAG